jgi:hypothetical protein
LVTWRWADFGVLALVNVFAVLAVGGQRVAVGALAGEAAFDVLAAPVFADVKPGANVINKKYFYKKGENSSVL